MEELEVILGQRTLAAVHGDQTTASAYAGIGTRHLLVLADGAQGPVPSRLAAQVAASAATARFRASVFPRTAEQLVESFAEAHGAVRRAALGTHAEGQAGAALIAVVVEPTGVTAARVGGGRAYVLRGDGVAQPLFRDAAEGFVGDERTSPEVVSYDEPLDRGARVVVLTESAARGVLADLEQLAAGPPAQIAAARLADAARRRGQYEPIAVQVMEIKANPARPGHHPALAKLGRARGRTLSADGRWIGRRDPANRSASTRRDTGWLLWFVVAVIMGAGAALVVHGDFEALEARGPGEAAVAVTIDPAAVERAVAQVDVSVAEPEPDVVEAPPEPALPPDVELAIAEAFGRDEPRAASRSVKAYITNTYPKRGDGVFDDLTVWVESHPTPHVVATLLELTKEQALHKTQRWIHDVLPRLYASSAPTVDADADADATP